MDCFMVLTIWNGLAWINYSHAGLSKFKFDSIIINDYFVRSTSYVDTIYSCNGSMVALGWVAITSSVVITIIAFIQNKRGNFNPGTQRNKDESPTQTLYVIGDLHGDVQCAKHWVHKTKLIPNLLSSPPSDWKWEPDNNDDASLLFLGDYVDKGPHSRPTLEFVKALTDRFPDKVTAILGNHEVELLKDRDSRYKTWGTAGYFQLPYATVHPAEYLHYLPPKDEMEKNIDETEDSIMTEQLDELVVEALYNASMEVYSYNLYQHVMHTPEGPNSITQLIQPPEWKAIVSDRLKFFQENYLNAYRTGTELGSWLETRPIMHFYTFNKNYQGSMLFVHGGINLNVAQYLKGDATKNDSHETDTALSVTESNVKFLNDLFHAHATDEKLVPFLINTKEGRLIEEMVTHRGNHKPNACSELHGMLHNMDGTIERLGVGHTPDENIRVTCDGMFLALDSLLGRWIREIGNDYCRGDKHQISQNGRYECPKIKDQCEGQIVRIRDGNLEIIS